LDAVLRVVGKHPLGLHCLPGHDLRARSVDRGDAGGDRGPVRHGADPGDGEGHRGGVTAAAYLVAMSLAMLAATLAGSYAGGGLAMAGIAGLIALSRSWQADPIQLIYTPSTGISHAAYRSALLAVALTVLAFRALERRTTLAWWKAAR